jgi:hypothetical protein
MKILKEAKEKLPVSFLTDFISRGWDDVGYLKETIAAIKEVYSGTKEIEDLLQALIDAYLVCIGQMEAHLHDNKYIEFPEEAKLNEDINVAITPEEVKVTDNSGEVVAEIPTEVKAEEEPTEVQAEEEPEEIKKELPDTEFEFFVDFDEPAEVKAAPLTDEEIEAMQKGM